jgi:hypothetical protein
MGGSEQIKRRYVNDDHTYQEHGIALFHPGSISVTRYRYRGARIPTPWTEPTADPTGVRAERARHEERLSIERVQQALA